MLQFGKEQKEKETCFVTHGIMGHLDPSQPPSKRKPYSALLNMPAVSKVEIIMPKSSYEAAKETFSKITTPTYSRVTLPLQAILSGDFFTEYIKKGNILMLSEGVYGVGNVYSLRDGILALSLDKESYERAGLVGKPDGVKGARGARARWVVEINLRLPSMLHGKKGFDRIVYAATEVLNKEVMWLFCNIGEAPSPDPLNQYKPTRVSCEADIDETPLVHVPLLQPPTAPSDVGVDEFSEFTTDIYEWLSLVQLESSRVDANDRIDSFLSRYTPPTASSDSTAEYLVRISWSGFMSSSWAHKAFVHSVLAATSKSWFAFSATGFQASMPAGARDCTILMIPGPSSDFLLWEVERN